MVVRHRPLDGPPSWATDPYLARVRRDILAMLGDARVGLSVIDVADLTRHPSPVTKQVLLEMIRRGEVSAEEDTSAPARREPRNLRRALAAALRGR